MVSTPSNRAIPFGIRLGLAFVFFGFALGSVTVPLAVLLLLGLVHFKDVYQINRTYLALLRRPMIISGMAYLLALLVASILSGSTMSMGMWLATSLMIVVPLFFAPYVQGSLLTQTLLPSLALGAMVTGGHSLYLHFTKHILRARGIWAAVNGIGLVTAMTLLILIGAFQHSQGWRRLLYLGGIIGAGVALFLSMSRGAWLGFLVGLILYGVRNRKTAIVACALLLISTLVFTFSLPLRNRLIRTFTTPERGRFEIYLTSINMVKDNPIIGIGDGMFQERYLDYQIEDSAYPNYAFSQAHNIFLQVATESGLIGLVGYLVLVGALLLAGFRLYLQPNHLNGALFCALIAGMVHNMVDSLFDVVGIGGMWWLLGISLYYVYWGTSLHLQETPSSNKQPQT